MVIIQIYEVFYFGGFIQKFAIAQVSSFEPITSLAYVSVMLRRSQPSDLFLCDKQRGSTSRLLTHFLDEAYFGFKWKIL